MRHSQSRYFRYVFSRINTKKYKVAILFMIIGVLLFYSLFAYESLQNENYIVARLPTTDLQVNRLNNLSRIDGVLFISTLNYLQVNNVLLLTASKNFDLFISKYLINGVLPSIQSNEVLGVTSYKNKLFVGEQVRFNETTKYKVVGTVQLNDIISVIGDTSNFVTIIKFTDTLLSRVDLLLISVHVFSNIRRIQEEIKEILGEKTIVYSLTVPNLKDKNVFYTMISSIIGYLCITFLYVMSIQTDCAILFALGWKIKNIYSRIYIEYSVVSLLGYILGLFSLVSVLEITHLTPFITHIVIIFLIVYIISGFLSVGFFSYLLIIKKVQEVLFR